MRAAAAAAALGADVYSQLDDKLIIIN